MFRANIPAHTFARRARWIGAVLVGVSLHAAVLGAPAGTGDDLDTFLAEKGLLSQLGEVGQNVTRTVTNRAGELVVTAMGFLGVPYKRGGNTFEGGLDCSGFVRAIYEQTAGLLLPRKAEQQAAATVQIDKADLQPGDLVFFNTLKKAFSHVGIYVGEGKFIHSPRSGSAVRVEDMQKAYWNSRFDGARRVDSTRQAAAD
jgi:cell wall-associated NlpC family hydrolase